METTACSRCRLSKEISDTLTWDGLAGLARLGLFRSVELGQREVMCGLSGQAWRVGFRSDPVRPVLVRQAWHVGVWFVRFRSGMVRQAWLGPFQLVQLRYVMAVRGRRGPVSYVTVMSGTGEVWHGSLGKLRPGESWRGIARHGDAWSGRRGKAWLGKVPFGTVGFGRFGTDGLGRSGCCMARIGKAWQARPGVAGHSKVR